MCGVDEVVRHLALEGGKSGSKDPLGTIVLVVDGNHVLMKNTTAFANC